VRRFSLRSLGGFQAEIRNPLPILRAVCADQGAKLVGTGYGHVRASPAVAFAAHSQANGVMVSYHTADAAIGVPPALVTSATDLEGSD